MFICTYNEDEAILERTIVGAAAMDYGRFRVWVLDDGRRPWLEALSRRLGVGYLTRPDNAHAKAGNINNALKHVAALPEPPDFITILDADFVPTSQFLRRALSLFREGDVGIVQTPQHFINPDPLQIQPVDRRRLARRAALLLRCGAGLQGCLGRRVLLRHVVGDPVLGAAAHRRLPDRTR